MPLPLLYTALTATLLAADPSAPAKAAEELPPPRAVIVAPQYPNYYRRSAWDVWQNYSMARDMSWQPRIDYAPGVGYFYVYNGKPYLYAENYQRWVSPTVQGMPYRSLPEMPPVIIQEEVLPAPAVKPEPQAAEVKPTSTKKVKRAAAKAPERMPYEEE